MNAGIFAPVVGGITLAVGVLSVITAAGGRAIIDTPAGNVPDMLVSIGAALAGWVIYKSQNGLAALFWVLLVIAMTSYAKWQVHTEDAARVTMSIGSSVVRGASSAVSAAGNEFSRGGNSPVPAQSNDAYRQLTQKEIQWCNSNPSNGSIGCKQHVCLISKCGAQGK